ncbi:hypothetical protein Patl1_14338 [Pistacia atlantica]|uniref:Uncharacterized protein n=1 Tax=Pistacia atlantica TaxID=434234 RepID=A0ACC1AVK3_9ROSI|nr:hypothetical protein Patl1_14338 [Pistacia atlantica]
MRFLIQHNIREFLKLSQAAPDLKFSFFSTAQSNASHFSKDNGEFSNIKPYNVDAGLPEGYLHKGNDPPKVEVKYFLKATPRNFQRAIQTVVAETGMEICCLIINAFLWFAAKMVKEMQVPWITFWNGGPLDECITILLHKMGQMLPEATAVAANSFEELDLPALSTLKSRLPKFLSVGPFTLTSPPPPDSDMNGCLEWLEQRKKSSVVYISFGKAILRNNCPQALYKGPTPTEYGYMGSPGPNQRTVETILGIDLEVEDRKFTKDGTMKSLRAILTTEKGKIMREKVGVLKQLALKAVESEGSSTANFKALVEIVKSKN